MTHVAFCWRTGVIGFASANTPAPEGVIVFATGDEAELKDICQARSRHGYEPDALLVPGIPEAPDDNDALLALQGWCDWAFKDWPVVDGVAVQPAGGEE